MSSDDLKTDGVDQAIKSAAKRAWCSECAPASLRKCVLNLMRCQEDPADLSIGSSRGGSRRRWMLWPIAAAAMIALVIGVTMMMSATPHSPANPANSIVATALPALPASLETALINCHEHCCHAADHHHVNAPKNDDAAIAQAMRVRLSQAVLMARPADPNWYFRGAAICPVGGTPAGHLVFARNDDVISIYSLPKQAAPNAKDGDQFEATIDGHPIAAFAKDGGLFCFVSSGPAGSVTLKQLTEMRDQMEDRVTTASAESKPSHETIATNLLYPIGTP